MITYLICKCHVYESRLLPRRLILELASASKLEDFIEMLSATAYGDGLLEAKSIWDVEAALTEKFINRLSTLLRVSPENIREFLIQYYRRFEIQNLIRIMRMKLIHEHAESIKRLIIPSEMLGGMDLDPFIGAKNFNEFINLLAGTRYKAISKMDIENPLILESMFRWIYYQGVFDKVSKIPRADRPDVMKILGIELDLHNIRVCILPILYDYDRKLAENLLIDNPAGKSKGLLMELRSIEELLESFPRYRVFIEALMRREEWRAEIEYFRILKDEVDGKRISKYINFFYVLKYILDCEVEYRNLRSIAISLYHNLPVNIRRSLLILPRT
ncbi:MAG: V-type ATPase subunit [Thaumarchaeota archaeon]|nr:V-type ATPase subunit [Nitrososphaerota archaeon]